MWDMEIQTHAAGRSPKAPNTDPRHWRGWARALPAQKPTAHKKGPQTERRERTELSSPATSLLGSTPTWPLLLPTPHPPPRGRGGGAITEGAEGPGAPPCWEVLLGKGGGGILPSAGFTPLRGPSFFKGIAHVLFLHIRLPVHVIIADRLRIIHLSTI